MTFPGVSSFHSSSNTAYTSSRISSRSTTTTMRSISWSSSSILCRDTDTLVLNAHGNAENLYDDQNIKNNNLLNHDDDDYDDDNDAIESSNDHYERRKLALHSQLAKFGIDANDLADAAIRSITTTDGYDPKYGKSAIRAYRSYMDPKPQKKKKVAKRPRKGNTKKYEGKKDDAVSMRIEIGAASIARQIEFLAKRNRSHRAEWVRHTDIDVAELTQTKNSEQMKKQTFPLIILLDNVRSAFNVGSIFRTADACNCHQILTTGITPHPNGSGMEKLQKCALGADRIVSTKHFGTTIEALAFVRKTYPHWMVVGLETTEGSQCYTDVIYPGGDDETAEMEVGTEGVENSKDMDTDKDTNYTMMEQHNHGTVLVLGNEVTGVDTEIMAKLDLIVEIPMFGAKNSLNIAACAPVVMYEILRQWGK
eukprot:CAMPEP_0198273842 /NCGR_PEP_ID=MMETSP1447-20131203/58204_1 /TAXON_ID=420782 /ORGANISM="Chaetoceros dichaeta, Strain CCMP1751" /LENGTH=421 /DNA_ID=CAMNT_0043967707 /DNA_START=60 /DNA_END=1325 /DNA_ORIENTATION=+